MNVSEKTTRENENESAHSSGISGIGAAVVTCLVLLGVCAAAVFWKGDTPIGNVAQADSTDHSALATKLAGGKAFPVSIQRPAGPPTIDTGVVDFHGNALTVSCSVCHTTRPANFENKTADDMNEFHSELELAHGTISCLSCHNSDDYDSLKAADGSRIEFTDVMTMCSQCHGKQAVEYENGVHGGMTGHWDARLGPQSKNSCIDCHHPHAPSFPKMKRTFYPKDRFLEAEH